MRSISLKSLFWLSALTWILVGMFLTSLGFKLLMQVAEQHGHFSLVNFFSSMMGDRIYALVLLLMLCIAIGYLKGRYVLKKTVAKQIKRLNDIKRPLDLNDLYTKKYLLLIALMISLGFILRALPIHSDVRGFVDLCVGSALLIGATNYFRVLNK